MKRNKNYMIKLRNRLSKNVVALITICLLSVALSFHVRAETTTSKPGKSSVYNMEQLMKLNHTKLMTVFKTIGLNTPDSWLNCLCRSAGYGSPGTRQFYHPDTLGKYNEAYSCQHPGEPCVVAGYGCTRHPLPKNLDLMIQCAITHKIDGKTNIVDVVSEKISERKKLSGCQNDEKDNIPPLLNVPPSRQIYAISPELKNSLKLVLRKRLSLNNKQVKKLIKKYYEIRNKYKEIKNTGPGKLLPNELDVRLDMMDAVEFAAGEGEDGSLIIKEIVLKLPRMPGKTGVEFATGLRPNGKGGLEPDGTLKFGFAKDGNLEVKFGLKHDLNKGVDYYYDEWQKPSEYIVLRAVGDVLSKLDLYWGGAGGVTLPGTTKSNLGVEAEWSGRQSYSDALFYDMHEALDNLLAQQKEWEGKRHKIIQREAERFGIDTRCITIGQTLKHIWKKWEQLRKEKPNLKRPFKQ